MSVVSFRKYHGTGNDFILIDNRTLGLENKLDRQKIARWCDRHFGIGADGLILLSPSEAHDFRMIYYNSDGAVSTLCGNGSRCLVHFARRQGLLDSSCTFEAADGPHRAEIEGDVVSLEMRPVPGIRRLSDTEAWLDSGSPHFVRFQSEPVAETEVDRLGREIRHRDMWKEEGTNVNFVNILRPGSLRVRTYERGVEGETLSCGTGVTACAVAYRNLFDFNGKRVDVSTPGGQLAVTMQEDSLRLIGPARAVFTGEIEL